MRLLCVSVKLVLRGRSWKMMTSHDLPLFARIPRFPVWISSTEGATSWSVYFFLYFAVTMLSIPEFLYDPVSS